jgi:RTX calcium-binding nonapeptide repeat (4 copies)
MANFIVTNLNDSGAGSLRGILAVANSDVAADTITFAAGLSGGTLVLTSGQLNISNDVTISGDVNGDNKADITISGNNAMRILNLSGSATDGVLKSLALTAGNAGGGAGGAIYAEYGTLTISDTSITNSSANWGGAIRGYKAQINIVNSLIANNGGNITGGGLSLIDSKAGSSIIQTTIYANSCNGDGGGIYINNATASNFSIIESTITNNHSDADGGITARGGGIAIVNGEYVNLSLFGNVIAGNTFYDGSFPSDVTGTIFTAENNAFGTTPALITNGIGNIFNVPVGLGELLDNGGTVLTRSPLDGSVLIATGNNAALPLDTFDVNHNGNVSEILPTDGRGGLRIVGGTVDIGAVEQIINETIRGTAGNNNIIGGLGTDNLSGLDGDDTINGGAGADTLNGGTNTAVGDTLTYVNSALSVTVNLALNTASGGDAQGDIFSNFENVTGSSLNDQLTGSAAANVLSGGAGDDLLVGGLGADKLDGGDDSDIADYRASTGTNVSVNLLADTASGGHAQGDTLDNIENLFGSFTQRDILIGNSDNNILKGFGGIDSLQGGDGDDFIEGGADGDAISGGAGVNDWASYRDSTVGTVSINLLTAVHSGGDAQGDTLFFIENLEGSLTKRDILIGNIVANRIIGNGGVDTIQGGDGNDFIDGGTGGDSLSAGAGIDTVSYEKSTAGVTVNLNVALQVSAGDANGDSLFFFENVIGSNGVDTITGNIVSNRITGGAGADTLNGALGSDYLTGGADADTFRFSDLSFGSDTIMDWQDGVDKISIALPLETSFAGLTFTGNGTASVIVKGFNGSGSSLTVKADAAFTLDAGDFVFV